MSNISVRYGSASIELNATVELHDVRGSRVISYLPSDLLAATEQALRAIGTAESHALANGISELPESVRR